MEDYLRTVGEEISFVDAEGVDPRYSNTGRLHGALDRLQRSYKKADPPPGRVKPIPMQLLRHAVDNLQSDALTKAVADLLQIGMFYLLRPGEHTYSSDNNHPFRLCDVSFQSVLAAINATHITQSQLDASNRVHLNFTTQKNGEKGEAITHGDTDDFISPFKAVRRRIEHLQHHNAPSTTPLHTVYINGTTRSVTSGMITNALRESCKVLGPSLGIKSTEISARALRAAGAMALLRARVDPSIIRLVGRWKSWTMLRYLHRSATETTEYAQRMLDSATYVLSTHATLPDDAVSLIQQADPDDLVPQDSTDVPQE